MEAKEKWIMYTKNSTFHGLDRAFDQSRNLGRRIIWMAMILGTFIFMVYTLSFGVSNLLHPEYTTQISVTRAPSIPFPAVTFCAANTFRRSYAENDPEVLAYIMVMAGKLAKHVSENKTLTALAKAVSLSHLDPRNLTLKLMEASHPLSETIYHARIFGDSLCTTTFVPELTSFGMCYRFNTSAVVREAGQDSGLLVYSLVNSDEYFYNNNGIDSLGTKLLPHSPDVFPEVTSRGIGAGVKTDTLISLQKRITYLLPETGCVTGGYNTLMLYDTYSQSACMKECSIKHQVNICGCKSYYDPGNYTLCLTKGHFKCLKRIAKNDSYSDISCDCPPKCIEESFDTKIFGMPFPSQYSKDLLNRQGNRRFNGNWDKLARMTIYFETMDVTTIVEKKTYSADSFFSDVGGLMGLWLGASVITWAELVEVLWDMCTNTKQSQQTKTKTKTVKVAPVNMVCDTCATKQLKE